jgi:hypothetical protein
MICIGESMLTLLKGLLAQFRNLIARRWIAPLDDLAWEMIGFEQSSSRYILRTAVAWIKDLGRLIYTGFRVNISRWDGSEWSVIYVNDDAADSEKELQYLLFTGTPTETKLGRAFLWQLPALIQRFVSHGYLVVCDVNRLVKWKFQGMYCIRVFPWLRSLVDVSVPMEAVVGRMRRLRKSDLLKAQRLGLEYGVSHELADLEVFYHKMYVPHISERYHERAIIHSYEEQREVFEERGQLLCVKYQGNLVAACLGTLRRYGRTFSALLLGVHQDFAHLVKQGVITALYWHVMNWAHSNQLFVVDFGRVRARLNDGLFSFKRQSGMWFERDIVTHTMWTFVGKSLPVPLVRRLNELAFIAEVGKEYRCVVFDCDEATLPEKELTQREKIVAQAGLDGLLVL